MRSKVPSLLALLLLPWSGCAYLNQLFQKPSVSIRSVDLTSLSFTGIGANFVMNVDNPNPIGIDLARLAYQLTIEGKQLAQGQANQAASVPANGSGTITLPVTINFADFVDSIEALFKKETVSYGIALAPGFNTPLGIIDIPLSHQGQFPVPRLPDVSLGTPSVSGIDLGGASLALPIQIHNRNGFALPVGGLRYKLVVGGNSIAEAGASPGSVAANQVVSVPVVARIHFAQTGLGLMRALQEGSTDVGLTGLLDLGGYQLPLNLATRLGR